MSPFWGLSGDLFLPSPDLVLRSDTSEEEGSHRTHFVASSVLNSDTSHLETPGVVAIGRNRYAL